MESVLSRYAFAGPRLLVKVVGDRVSLPAAPVVASVVSIPLGPGSVADVLAPDAEAPVGHELLGLRELFGRLSEEEMRLAGRASQLVNWYQAHAFCGWCGSPTYVSDSEIARVCSQCKRQYFPRLNPVVVMRVDRDSSMLLARSRNFAADLYSVLAGFVEPGETLEEAVAREVFEEVGLSVIDVKYFGSQPWPFPSQLMIGFIAHAAPGEIRLGHNEIVEARWFQHGDRLPRLPGLYSVSRWLINDFLAAEHGS